MSAQSVRSKTLGDGTGTLLGGASETFVLAYEDGNIEWDSPKAEQVVVYDRNDIVGLRKGKNQTGTITFTVDLRQFTNSDTANPTIIDVLEESGSSNRAGWVTTGGLPQPNAAAKQAAPQGAVTRDQLQQSDA